MTGTGRTTASGTLAVTLGATAFSFGFILVRLIGLPPPTLGLYRTLIGAAFLGAIALALKVPRPPTMVPVVLAGIAFGAHQLLFIAATQKTSIAIVTLVGAMTPLLVSMAGPRLIGERPPKALKYYALLAASGVAVVVLANQSDSSRSIEGDLLAVGNLFVFAAFFLFAKRARAEGTHTVALTAWQTAIAAVVIAPALLFVTPRVPSTGNQWLLLAALALGPGSGHLLVNWAHRRISAALSALVLTTVPVLASLWAYLVFDEPFGPAHFVGMGMVVSAVELARRAEVRAITASAAGRDSAAPP